MDYLTNGDPIGKILIAMMAVILATAIVEALRPMNRTNEITKGDAVILFGLPLFCFACIAIVIARLAMRVAV
jgi:hypothetical protein